jgi:hypothetical protein
VGWGVGCAREGGGRGAASEGPPGLDTEGGTWRHSRPGYRRGKGGRGWGIKVKGVLVVPARGGRDHW